VETMTTTRAKPRARRAPRPKARRFGVKYEAQFEALNSIQKRTARRVLRICTVASDILGMAPEWEIGHVFNVSHDGEDSVEKAGTVSVFTTMACTVAQWQYGRAKIRWYLPMCVGATDEQILRNAIHEFVHVLNSPTAGLIKAGDLPALLDEKSTENVTRAIEHAVEWGRRNA